MHTGFDLNRRAWGWSGFVASVALACAGADADELGFGKGVQFNGALHEPGDISGIAQVGGFLVIGSDEGHVVQILERVDNTTYALKYKYTLPQGALTTEISKRDPEIDIEGIAAVGQTVFVLGSHSRKRRRVAAGDAKNRRYARNRERLQENLPEQSRRVLYRFKLDAEGRLDGAIDEKLDIYGLLRIMPPLNDFKGIPSKENGIDLEGLAAVGETVLIGFRGPVLRENWVPVLVFEFGADLAASNPAADLRFLNLGGLGIRGMTRVADGFLLVAGPVGDGPGDYELYHWDGRDTIPGDGGENGRVVHLGTVPTVANAKAEGIAVLGETATHYDLMVVWDGQPNGAPRRFEVEKKTR